MGHHLTPPPWFPKWLHITDQASACKQLLDSLLRFATVAVETTVSQHVRHLGRHLGFFKYFVFSETAAIFFYFCISRKQVFTAWNRNITRSDHRSVQCVRPLYKNLGQIGCNHSSTTSSNVRHSSCQSRSVSQLRRQREVESAKSSQLTHYGSVYTQVYMYWCICSKKQLRSNFIK